MAEFSDGFENSIINLMRNTAFTQVAAYVALFISPVTDAELEAGTITNEVSTSGTAYARQLAGLSAPSNGASSNAADITWTQATASWGTVTHCALVRAVSGATDVFMWSALDASKVIDTGDTFKINAGDLDVTIA